MFNKVIYINLPVLSLSVGIVFKYLSLPVNAEKWRETVPVTRLQRIRDKSGDAAIPCLAVGIQSIRTFASEFSKNITPGLLATDIHIQILIILPMTISD